MTADLQNALNTPRYGAARTVVDHLRQAGHQAFFAGGCVRDLLLNIPPQDFDVATSATPEEVLSLFTALGHRTVAVGAHFGVILVCLGTDPDDPNAQTIQTEVATFRHDGSYTDGRRPDAVQFSTSPREDVLRRDFTVNGMLLDPEILEATGQVPPAVLDFVNGREDLATKTLRAIGNPHLRFTEDKLRMLRAIRFAARLHFHLDPATLAAIQQLAPEIHQVSAERIREELTRMLTEGNARRAFELLDTSGLLAHVLPEAVRMHGVEQPPDWHPEGDVWTHTMLLLQNLPPRPTATLAWGALLHDIGKPATYHLDQTGPAPRIRFNGHVEVGVRVAEVILRRLRFSNDDTAQILALVHHHMRFGDVPQMRESTIKRFLRLPKFDEHLHLHWLDCTACHNRLGIWHDMKARFEAEPEPDTRPELLLSGRDLIRAGYQPGPTFKAMLEATEDAQLEGTLHTPEEALSFIAGRFGAPTPQEQPQ